ncbi:prolipoprotein diacylglyceryl transferase [Psittacicella melopsittaci]|uniref:Phosphatidylglycerol--prolipoprotein diacylglyceryl transferase n=1 Tax=Psittacicella melopsittaci TaxID=2028576 RepID=A0A3A1Y422_9GAMM|nr:prolipoprotein diacylglyceryl transferase [Psittacicella melopsittaci]RIY32993.1 prolipoprotein diacylglyceryl transferase [Psittacicella melopsittaci]
MKFLILLGAILLTQNSFAYLNFPDFNPVAFSIFGFSVRWYGLFYLFGLAGAIGLNYLLLKSDHKHSSTYNANLTASKFNDIAINCFLAAIIGGRLFYVIFYDLSYYLAHPIEVFYLHKGGMSFHGGFVGAVVALYWQTRKEHNFWQVADLGATVIPFALGLGRLANFINGELWGRATDVPWAMIFPTGGNVPRHPSQLYEAILEGAVLLIILIIVRKRRLNLPGLLSGIFVFGYGLSRFIVEFFREPDAQLGYIVAFFTQGQLLSLPMIIVGLWIMLSSKKRALKYDKG